MFYPDTIVCDPTVEVVRKTAGLQNGYRTPKEVQDVFGINVYNYPKLFRVTPRNGLVIKLEEYEAIYQEHLAKIRNNWHVLGVL
jgi:hypothetical protein